MWSDLTIAEAQEIHLLHDITLKEDPALGSIPESFHTLDSLVLFRARTSNHRDQIWRTNGTELGTWMVKELPFYENMSNFISFTGFNHKLYFTVVDQEYGQQIWVTDGTSDGTKPVFGTSQSKKMQNVHNITEFNGFLYFTAVGEDIGTELWRTDVISKPESFDLTPGVKGSAPYMLTVAGNNLYFVRNSTQRSQPLLLVTDGIDFDTLQVQTDYAEWQISNLTSNGNGLFFYVKEYRGTGQELWYTDGTSAGTRRVKSILPKGNGFSQSPSLFKVVDDKLYFYATTPKIGQEIWVSDGTDTGTHVLAEMISGAGSTFGANDVVKFKDELYFTQFVQSKGIELVKYNPVLQEFQLVKDVFEHDSLLAGAIGPLIIMNDKLFFQGMDSINNRELWSTDGTEDGTNLFVDINPKGSSNPWLWHKIGNQYVFSADDGTRGRELWITDGTVAGTRLLKNIRTTKMSSTPRRLTPYLTSLSFIVGTLIEGNIGMVEDDTIRTLDFLDTIVGGNAVSPSEMLGVKNTLYFRGESERYGSELWKTDGSPEGTQLVKDIVPGSGSSFPLFLTKLNDEVYFRVDNSIISNSVLYKTDGTEENTELIGSLWKEYERAIITKIFATKNNVFFFAQTPALGLELFVTDGTLKSTRLVKDICGGKCSGPKSDQVVAVNNGVIYFTANSWNKGEELWRSDGTEEGTFLVKDMYGGSQESQPRILGSFNNYVFFAANKNSYNYELWKTDGTEEGTEVFPDVFVNVKWQSGIIPGKPTAGVQMKDAFYFVASTPGGMGYELWRTDGTIDGTSMVKDIETGPNSSGPDQLVVLNDTLYFAATTQEHGRELWKSDGTYENTRMVGDIIPNGESSNPIELMTIGNRLYFVASHLEHGRELFYIEDPNYQPKPAEEDDDMEEHEARFVVSPVPANEHLEVIWGDPFEQDDTARKLIVYDILGRPVIKKEVSGGSVIIGLTGVTSGSYILRLEGIGTTKFIKH